MTAPDRAALGERAARALQSWEKGAAFDVLLRLVVDFASIEIAGEREVAAVIVEGFANGHHFAGDRTGEQSFKRCAESIRARGTESKTGG